MYFSGKGKRDSGKWGGNAGSGPPLPDPEERLVRSLCKYEAQQGGFHGDPVSRNQSCQWPPTGTVTLKELQWKYLPNAVLTVRTWF